jgi:hypothetical protein
MKRKPVTDRDIAGLTAMDVTDRCAHDGDGS